MAVTVNQTNPNKDDRRQGPDIDLIKNKWSNLQSAHDSIYTWLADGVEIEGGHKYPHSSIYNVRGNLVLLPGSFLRLFSCIGEDITLNTQNTLFFRGGTFTKLHEGKFCNIRCEKECRVQTIENLTNCRVILDGCELCDLQINNCVDCVFFIKGGSCDDETVVFKNNKGCLFHLESVGFTKDKVFLQNSECSILMKGCTSKARNFLEANTKMEFEAEECTFELPESGCTVAKQEQDYSVFMKKCTIIDKTQPNKTNIACTFINTNGIFQDCTWDVWQGIVLESSSVAFLGGNANSEDWMFQFSGSSVSFYNGTVTSKTQNCKGLTTIITIDKATLTAQQNNFDLLDLCGIVLKEATISTSGAHNFKADSMLFFEAYESQLTAASNNLKYDELYRTHCRSSKFTNSGRNFDGPNTYDTVLYKNEFSNGYSGVIHRGPPGTPEMPNYCEISNFEVRGVMNPDGSGGVEPQPGGIDSLPGGEPATGPTPDDCGAYKKAVESIGGKWDDNGLNIIGVNKAGAGYHVNKGHSDEMVVCGPGTFKKYPASTSPGVPGKRQIVPNQQIQFTQGLHKGETPVLVPTGTKYKVRGPDGKIVPANNTAFHIHYGGRVNGKVGEYSHGCQVIGSTGGGKQGDNWKEFQKMTVLNKSQKTFNYTLLTADKFK